MGFSRVTTEAGSRTPGGRQSQLEQFYSNVDTPVEATVRKAASGRRGLTVQQLNPHSGAGHWSQVPKFSIISFCEFFFSL